MPTNHVNFSFGGRPGETERWPFRLAVLAEFLPRVYETAEPDPRAFRAAVDKDNFNEVMARTGLHLRLDIANPLGSQPKEWHLDLGIVDLKSFRPESIVDTVPQLGDLIGVRALLAELAQRKLTAADFREQAKNFTLPADLSEKIVDALYPPQKQEEKPAPAPSAPPKSKPDQEGRYTLDAILEMVDTGEPSPSQTETREKVESALDDFLGASKMKGEALDSGVIQNATAHVDALLTKAMNAILHHPELQRVEAVWRGLKYLVDQTDFRKNVRLEIIHTDKEHLGKVFAKDIYQTEYEGQSEVPLAAAVAAFEFDTHPPDIDLLRDLAQKAGEIPFVVIASVGASFFGLDGAGELSKLPYLGTLLESPQYAKFNGLREEQSSRWLALGFNRFLLRYLYGHEGWRVKSFDFKESAADEADYLWGNPVWALAAQLTRSYARVGWATQISGRRNGGVLENLPIRTIRLPNGEPANIPVETLVPDRRLEELDRSGIIPLLCDINSDSAYLLATPTVHRPAHDADSAKAERNAFATSLPNQMYVGEIARFINRKHAEFTTGLGAGEVETRFAGALKAFNVARDEPGDCGVVHVQIQDSATRTGHKELVIQVSSPKRVLHGRAGTELTLPIRA